MTFTCLLSRYTCFINNKTACPSARPTESTQETLIITIMIVLYCTLRTPASTHILRILDLEGVERWSSLIFLFSVARWVTGTPARALLQWSSNLSVHKKHVESLIKHIAVPHSQRFWLFTWFGWGLRIYNSRGPGDSRVAGDSETTTMQCAIIHPCG